jgi:hypothetical protein
VIVHDHTFFCFFTPVLLYVKWSKTTNISRDRARSQQKDIKHNMFVLCRDHNIHGCLGQDMHRLLTRWTMMLKRGKGRRAKRLRVQEVEAVTT